MELILSPNTRTRIFNRKMKREKLFSAHTKRWANKTECMMTHKSRFYSSYGFYTLRADKYTHMGVFDTPIYNVRASKIIRDTEAMLRRWTDPETRRRTLENSRYAEVRGEIKDKWISLLNRHNFFAMDGK